MKTDPEYENLFDVLLNLNLEVKDYLEMYEDNHRALVIDVIKSRQKYSKKFRSTKIKYLLTSKILRNPL
jgi:hypothetical protein